MNTKQQIATGFLAMLVVGSIAFMPVNAEVKNSQISVAPKSDNVVTSLNSAETPQEQVKDLTYN